MKKNAFTILELLVVLAVMGVFTAIAYPNISNWIADRNVKKEVYETVAFIKERKAEVTSGKYGMVQVLLNDQLEVFTMSPEKFFQIYKGFSSPYSSHKQAFTCGFSDTAGFTIESKYSSHDFGVNASNSNVNVYPSAYHNPMRSAICITKASWSNTTQSLYSNIIIKFAAVSGKSTTPLITPSLSGLAYLPGTNTECPIICVVDAILISESC